MKKNKLVIMVMISAIVIMFISAFLIFIQESDTTLKEQVNNENTFSNTTEQIVNEKKLNWIILVSEKKPINDERLKKWVEGKLTWNDFTGMVPNQPTNLAYTYTFLDYYYSIESLPVQECKFIFTNVGAQALMVSFNSWSIKSRQSESLLKHEQGHFDIAQIHAQKLQQIMVNNLVEKEFDCAPLSVSNDKTTRMEVVAKELSENLFHSIENGWYEMDKNYDSETMAGINSFKQDEWNSIIVSLLNDSEMPFSGSK